MDEGEHGMTLTEFLLARIAEDEANAWEIALISSAAAGPPYWTPSRIQAECEAKRRIVELYEDAVGDMIGGHAGRSTGVTAYDALRTIALPYADHPDYAAATR
jgi:hypothetical protein